MINQISMFEYIRDIELTASLSNPFSQFVDEEMFNVSKEQWTKLNNIYTKDEIIEYMSDLILSGKIEMPMVKYSQEDAINSFNELLSYKCNGIRKGDVFTRYDYEYQLSGYYLDESNVGNVASNYFQQENRYYCDSINQPSPYRVWHNEKFLKSALGALYSLKCTEINASTLRTVLHLRKYVASQFKPSVAKAIYENFKSERVLDICSGWGDRLCGFFDSPYSKLYVGIDPNSRVHNAYQQQIDTYRSLTNGKDAMMIKAPAEDVSLSPNSFDIVFTSPPYFNMERYSQEDTQSFKRYHSLEQWLEGFLFKVIKMSYESLRHGGFMVINMSDVYTNHTINKICDPMNKYIEELGGNYIDGIGMRMAKRPNSKALKNKNGVFVEPIWIWQKK